MRITLLCTSSLEYPSPRGRWLPLAKQLAKLGHEPQLLLLHHTYDRLPAAQRRLNVDGVMVHYVGQMHVYGPVGQRRYFGAADLLRISVQGAVQLARAALRYGADALHVCKPQPINGLGGMVAARALRCPLYVDCDDYEAGGNRFGAAWQRWMVQLWEDRLPQHARAITVNTRFLHQRYQMLNIEPTRINYVPNGVAPEQLRAPDTRQVAGLGIALERASRPIVLYVGTLSRTTHNVDLLIAAFALVAQRVPHARLVLVGDGEDRAALELSVAELGLRERVLFVGAVPADTIPIWFAQATCSVDPVGDDGVARGRSPLKIVESMALGVPVVTGNVGDRAEMLAGSGGLIVQPGSAEALADGIGSLLEDTTRQQALAVGARERSAVYCWERLVHDWLQVYA